MENVSDLAATIRKGKAMTCRSIFWATIPATSISAARYTPTLRSQSVPMAQDALARVALPSLDCEIEFAIRVREGGCIGG
jgi:hypothetical protein